MPRDEPSVHDEILYEEYKEVPLPDKWEGMNIPKAQAWLHGDDLEQKRKRMIKAKRRKK